MKTIEEAAFEYVLNGGSKAENAFISGAEFAQRWIDVNEKLPEDTKNVLVKILCQPHLPTRAGQPIQKKPFTIITLGSFYKGSGGSWDIIHNLIKNKFHAQSWKVTHWRPIEYK
jgi:hypothetical protein